MPLMLRLFRALFPSKERQEFQSRLREPLPSAPPPLPLPKLKYVLYTNGDGSYDIWDGGISQSKQSVGGFFKQPGIFGFLWVSIPRLRAVANCSSEKSVSEYDGKRQASRDGSSHSFINSP